MNNAEEKPRCLNTINSAQIFLYISIRKMINYQTRKAVKLSVHLKVKILSLFFYSLISFPFSKEYKKWVFLKNIADAGLLYIMTKTFWIDLTKWNFHLIVRNANWGCILGNEVFFNPSTFKYVFKAKKIFKFQDFFNFANYKTQICENLDMCMHITCSHSVSLQIDIDNY